MGKWKNIHLVEGIRNWYRKNKWTIIGPFVVLIGCGVITGIAWTSHRCMEDGCYRWAWDGILCDKHWQQTKEKWAEQEKKERAELEELQKRKEERESREHEEWVKRQTWWCAYTSEDDGKPKEESKPASSRNELKPEDPGDLYDYDDSYDDDYDWRDWNRGSAGNGATAGTTAPYRPTQPTMSAKKRAQKSYEAYDEGYDAVYDDDDYDWDRYQRDPDYADGVDDAMDELDW